MKKKKVWNLHSRRFLNEFCPARAMEEGDVGTEEGGWGEEKSPEEAETNWLR